MTTGQVQCLFQHPAHRHSYHHRYHHLHHHHQLTRKWKEQTRGPLVTPAQIIWLLRGPYPHRWKHARSWFKRQELTPRRQK